MKHKRSLMKFLITIDKFKQHLKKTESDSKPEENIAERVKLRRQKSEKKRICNDFLQQIKEEQKKYRHEPV